ncbi:hypothetical protein C8R45DRAFT_937329 [Mycena sanguinolenta]|nr:hypothetical protein C8R45DRAFT_937329 [Mycena sanguinolenta]
MGGEDTMRECKEQCGLRHWCAKPKLEGTGDNTMRSAMAWNNGSADQIARVEPILEGRGWMVQRTTKAEFRHRELCRLQGDNIDGMKSRGGSHIMGGQRTTWGRRSQKKVRWCAAWNSIHREQCRGDEGHMHAAAESKCRGRVRHTWLTAQKGGIRRHVAGRMILEDQYNSERPGLEQQCVRNHGGDGSVRKRWSGDDRAMTQKEDRNINSRGYGGGSEKGDHAGDAQDQDRGIMPVMQRIRREDHAGDAEDQSRGTLPVMQGIRMEEWP